MMKKFEKRLLSLLLCVILMLGVLPAGLISVSAAEDVSTFQVEGIKLTAVYADSNATTPDAAFNLTGITQNGFTMSYDGKLIYGVTRFAAMIGLNQCAPPEKNVANFIINKSDVDRVLSFDYVPSMSVGAFDTDNQVIGITAANYTVYSNGYISYGGVFQNPTNVNDVAGHMEIEIPKNQYKMVQFEVYKSVGSASLTISNVSLTEKPSEFPDVTVNAMGEGSGKVQTAKSSDGVTLTATADSGAVFIGYLDEQGNVLSSNAAYSFMPTSATTVCALFGKESSQKNFRVGRYGRGYCYTDTLEEALAMVRYFTDKTIIVNKEVVLSGDYSIPADVTLVVPEAPETGMTDCVLYTNDPHIVTATTPEGVYKRLVLDTGSTLEVKGTLYVGGSMYINIDGDDSYAMTGKYGMLYLKNGSTVNLTNGSRLYAWGFVCGGGVVNASAGSSAYEMLQICDWRHGTNTLLTILGSAFPFEQFYVQNIEAKIVFQPGASEIVLGLGSLGGIAVPVSLPFIGEAGSSLFSVNNGEIAKYVGLDWDDSTYKAKTDSSADPVIQDKKLHIDITGTAKVTHFPLVSIFGADSNFVTSMSQTSSNPTDFMSMFAMLDTNFLSIPISNMSINLAEDSYLSTDQPLTILPGSDITIGERSLFELNASVTAIDSEAWCLSHAYDDNNKPVSYHFTGKKGQDVVKLQHSPSYTDTRTNTTMADPENAASIVIDGTLQVNDGLELNLGTLFTVVSEASNSESKLSIAIGNAAAEAQQTGDTEVLAFINSLSSSNTNQANQARYSLLYQYIGKTPCSAAVLRLLYLIDKYDDAITLNTYSFKTSDMNGDPGSGDYLFDDFVKSSVTSNGTGTVRIARPLTEPVEPLLAIDNLPQISPNPQDWAATISEVNESFFVGMYMEPAWLQNEDKSYVSPFAFIEEYEDYYGPAYNMFVYRDGSWEPQLKAEYVQQGDDYYFSDWVPLYTDGPYTITWLDENGASLGTTSVFAGETPTHEIPVKADDASYTYTFAGWNRVDNGSNAAPAAATANATYQASYSHEVNSYTVTFLDSDGTTVLDEQTVAAGCTPDLPDTDYYVKGTGKGAQVFTGWTSDGVTYSDYELPAVTSDVTFTAGYKGYYYQQTLQDVSEIDYNLYFSMAAAEAAKSALHVRYTKDNVTLYKDIELVDSGNGLYKAQIQLPPAELTNALDVTLTVDGVDLHYDMKAANYADSVFSADSTLKNNEYYLVGVFSGENCWPDNNNVKPKYKFVVNPSNSSEYMLRFVELHNGDQIKVVQKNSNSFTYFPNMWDGKLTDPKSITEDGYYDVYFRPDYQGYGTEWYYQTILVKKHEASQRSVTSALMNYGTKAQDYFTAANKFDYNTADLANSHVSGHIYTYDDTKTDTAIRTAASGDGASTMKDMDLSSSGLEYYGSTFILNSGTVMRHYFRITDSNAVLPTEATFSVAGKANVTAEAQTDGYFIWFDYVAQYGNGIPGPELGLTVTCTINMVQGKYSFMNYAKTAITQANKAGAAETAVKLGALVRAMYWYYEESSVFFAQ